MIIFALLAIIVGALLVMAFDRTRHCWSMRLGLVILWLGSGMFVYLFTRELLSASA